ncbi:uncharacterized protein LOC144011517, partial [Festucalex cinctus]
MRRVRFTEYDPAVPENRRARFTEHDKYNSRTPTGAVHGIRPSYASLSRHVKGVHGYKDDTMRRLYLAKKNLRYSGKLRCPVEHCDSKEFTRLDKHLLLLHGVEPGKTLAKIMAKAKKAAIKRQLRHMIETEQGEAEAVQIPPELLGTPPHREELTGCQVPLTPGRNLFIPSPGRVAMAPTEAAGDQSLTLTHVADGLALVKVQLQMLLQEVEGLQNLTQTLLHQRAAETPPPTPATDAPAALAAAPAPAATPVAATDATPAAAPAAPPAATPAAEPAAAPAAAPASPAAGPAAAPAAAPASPAAAPAASPAAAPASPAAAPAASPAAAPAATPAAAPAATPAAAPAATPAAAPAATPAAAPAATPAAAPAATPAAAPAATPAAAPAATPASPSATIDDAPQTPSTSTALSMWKIQPCTTPLCRTPNLENLLRAFTEHLTGPSQTSQARRNINQRRSYAKRFILHMSGVEAGSDINKGLQFLHDTNRLHDFLKKLQETLKPTSQKHVIVDVEAFLNFVAVSNLPKVRATKQHINYALSRLASWKKGLGAAIVKQRLEYKRAKKDKLVSSRNMLMFVKRAPSEAKAAINELAKGLHNTAALQYCTGLLVGVMAIMSGHRKCVFMSIKPENILEAELYKGTFIIRVPDHKTAQSFGPAMVTVNQVTMHCLLKLEKLRPHLRGFHKNPQTFFFNTQGSECVKMGEYFTKAWRQMGLPGKPNLRDIRTAIATWAGRSLAEPETKRINKSMCHDPKTA